MSALVFMAMGSRDTSQYAICGICAICATNLDVAIEFIHILRSGNWKMCTTPAPSRRVPRYIAKFIPNSFPPPLAALDLLFPCVRLLLSLLSRAGHLPPDGAGNLWESKRKLFSALALTPAHLPFSAAFEGGHHFLNWTIAFRTVLPSL